jgi:hypothetical protein
MMTARATTTYADLLAPARVRDVLDTLRSNLDTAQSPLRAFGALDELAALGCVIAGPDACREPLERGLALLPKVTPLLTPKLFTRYAATLKEVASFVRVAECAGLPTPALPIADYLPTLAASSAEMPKLFAATLLHAINEGEFALAKQLLGSRPPAEFDAAAPVSDAVLDFMSELCACAEAGGESAALARAFPQLLADSPDHTRPLSFPSLELMLIARVIKVRLRGEAPGTIARELHDYARSHAG